MAVVSDDELKGIIADIENLIESNLTEDEFKKIISGNEFKKIYDYVNENRTIPTEVHNDTTDEEKDKLFGKLIEKLQKAENIQNRRNKMVGREKVKDTRIKQAKEMRDIILGLKGRIIEKEIEEQDFDFEEFKEIKEKEVKDIQDKIDIKEAEIKEWSGIKNTLKSDKDLEEYRRFSYMKTALDKYEKIRTDLETENKKADADKDKNKITKLEEELKDAKVLIGASGVSSEFKNVNVNGKNIPLQEALKNNEDLSSIKPSIKLTGLKTTIDGKKVNDLFSTLSSTQKNKIAEKLGKKAPLTLEDTDITTDNLIKLIDETNKEIDKLKKENKKNATERDVKKETITDMREISILKAAKTMDRKNLYKNYEGIEQKDLIDSLDTRKGRIIFWKDNISGPFKGLRARFRARKSNIAETKAYARGSYLDKMLASAEVKRESYKKSFRESIKVGLKLQNKDKVKDLNREDIYKNMEQLRKNDDLEK